jgi:hypothetical protein
MVGSNTGHPVALSLASPLWFDERKCKRGIEITLETPVRGVPLVSLEKVGGRT